MCYKFVSSVTNIRHLQHKHLELGREDRVQLLTNKMHILATDKISHLQRRVDEA